MCYLCRLLFKTPATCPAQRGIPAMGGSQKEPDFKVTRKKPIPKVFGALHWEDPLSLREGGFQIKQKPVPMATPKNEVLHLHLHICRYDLHIYAIHMHGCIHIHMCMYIYTYMNVYVCIYRQLCMYEAQITRHGVAASDACRSACGGAPGRWRSGGWGRGLPPSGGRGGGRAEPAAPPAVAMQAGRRSVKCSTLKRKPFQRERGVKNNDTTVGQRIIKDNKVENIRFFFKKMERQ